MSNEDLVRTTAPGVKKKKEIIDKKIFNDPLQYTTTKQISHSRTSILGNNKDLDYLKITEYLVKKYFDHCKHCDSAARELVRTVKKLGIVASYP